MESAAREATVLLRAMANERRLMVLCHLSRGERSVTELCSLVEMSPSALSQHLAKLRRDGMVTTRRHAQTVFYSLKGDGPREVLDALHGLFCCGEADCGEADCGAAGESQRRKTAFAEIED